MDRRMSNVIKVGLICGVALILYTFFTYSVTDAIYKEMIRPPPVPAGSPTPTPVGNLSGGISALILDFIMLTIGSMLILGAGGVLFTWMSRGSCDTIGETVKWSSITGVFSYVSYVLITVVLVIVSATLALLSSRDLSGAFNGTISGAAASQVCCFPVTVVTWVLGVMSAAIGGFICAAYWLKQS